MSVFNQAMEHLFNSRDLTVPAVLQKDDVETKLKVILKTPDRIVGTGDSSFFKETVLADVLIKDAQKIERGDILRIQEKLYEVLSEPIKDSLNLIASLELAEIVDTEL